MKRQRMNRRQFLKAFAYTSAAVIVPVGLVSAALKEDVKQVESLLKETEIDYRGLVIERTEVLRDPNSFGLIYKGLAHKKGYPESRKYFVCVVDHEENIKSAKFMNEVFDRVDRAFLEAA